MSAVCLHFSPGEAVDLQGQPQGPHLKFVDFVVERNSIEVIFLELAIHILEVILEALYLKIISIFTGCSSWKSTDLGSLIGNTQCGNFRISLPHRFLREINSGDFEAPKNAILTIRADQNFQFWGYFDIFQNEIPKKIKISSPTKWLRWQFLNLWTHPKLISREIRMAGKLLKFPHCGIFTVKIPN